MKCHVSSTCLQLNLPEKVNTPTQMLTIKWQTAEFNFLVYVLLTMFGASCSIESWFNSIKWLHLKFSCCSIMCAVMINHLVMWSLTECLVFCLGFKMERPSVFLDTVIVIVCFIHTCNSCLLHKMLLSSRKTWGNFKSHSSKCYITGTFILW